MKYHIDFHVHTDRSPDGRSSLEALAAAAKKRGLDAIAVADHDLFTISAPFVLNGVVILPACECSTENGHLVGLLPEREPDCAALHAKGRLPSAAEAAAELSRCGALLAAAHPFGRPAMDLDALGFRPDAVETANARACFRTPEANRLAAEYAAAHALPEIGGSDAHSRAEVGNAYTVVDCADLSPETLREALRKGACSAVLVRPTSPLCKGLSQFKMARRAGNPRKLLRALLYLCYCLLLRIFSKR